SRRRRGRRCLDHCGIDRSMPDCKSHTYGDSNSYGDSNCHTNAYTYTNAYTNAHTTGADHSARAWLQSARPANGGPFLEWVELQCRRHLSQRRVHGHRAGPRWFLYRSHQPQWEGNLYL